MVLRVVLGLTLAAATVMAQWKRHANMPQGDWTDEPPGHDLAYFRPE
jgi:hypothetical protein